MRSKILILDDDTDIIALLVQAFRPLPFDALVMDCALPRLDGFTIAKIVRLAETTGVSKRTKIGYFTAFPKTVEQSTLLEEVGAQAYWRKPEDTGNLPTLISLWLNGPG